MLLRVSWRKSCVVEKQELDYGVTDSQSSVGLEYHAIANVTCEMVWVRNLLSEPGFALE